MHSHANTKIARPIAPTVESARFGRRRLIGAAWVAPVLALVGCVVPASPAPATVGGARSVFGLTLDNDYFTGSDNNYSNGASLSLLSGPVNEAPERAFSRRWANAFAWLPFMNPAADGFYVGIGFGQEMYTPDDITDPNPPLDDQPYAGVLFLDFTFAGRSETQCASWKFHVGTVGPSSQAEDVQTFVHDLLDEDEPQGWSTQLPNEPILNIDYNRVWEIDVLNGPDFGARFVPVAGASLGTYFTGASAAAYAEFGWNLPDTVGAVTLRQGVDPIGLIAASRNEDFSLSMFAGAGGFAVAHYLPLDGTVLRESRSVESEPLVGFLSGGASLRQGSFALTYMLSFFSEKFETERDRDDFGRVTLSWSF